VDLLQNWIIDIESRIDTRGYTGRDTKDQGPRKDTVRYRRDTGEIQTGHPNKNTRQGRAIYSIQYMTLAPDRQIRHDYMRVLLLPRRPPPAPGPPPFFMRVSYVIRKMVGLSSESIFLLLLLLRYYDSPPALPGGRPHATQPS